MSNYNYDYWTALQTVVESSLPSMGSNNHAILRISQANDLNWANIMDQFNALTTGGFQPPFVVVHMGAQAPDADYGGMHGALVRIPTTIYYVRRKGKNSTTVTQAATSATQIIGDTSWMTVGMPIKISGVVRTVLTINSGISVTFTASLTTAIADTVRETTYQDATEACMASLRDALLAVSGQAFQATDVPVVDCSDSNPANVQFQRQTVPLYAGMLTLPALCGETFTTVT